jgi:signal transduction histidine kinase
MERWLEAFAQANFRRSADTAHDLKTPLNVAVLNLELLRMRLEKLASASTDEKVAAYANSIENELRRMARIFDAFFLLSTPPKDEGAPDALDVSPLCREAAKTTGFELQLDGPTPVRAHEARIRQALQMFLEGASKVLKPEGRSLTAKRTEKQLHLSLSGQPEAAELELTKIFKFYYTDQDGSPDLSLATARLIAETYGGELYATEERDKVTINLSLPLGDR